MTDILDLILINMEKIGIGAILFLSAYISNMGLGAWKSINFEGYDFDWDLIKSSVIKFIVLTISIALLSVVVSIIPAYIGYVGIEIGAETIETIDAIVIIGSFLTATIKYVGDGISKLKNILGS